MNVVRRKVDGWRWGWGRPRRLAAGLAFVTLTAVATPSAAFPGEATTPPTPPTPPTPARPARPATPATGAEAPGTAGGFSRPVYVTNRANEGGGDANVARFTTGPDGRLTLAETVPAALGARTIVFAPDLRHAYLASFQAGELRTYDVARPADRHRHPSRRAHAVRRQHVGRDAVGVRRPS